MIVRCKSEYTVTGLALPSIQLDILAADEHGKFFNVEVHTESAGAPTQRARYYSGAVDTGHFTKDEDYQTLFDTYDIFVRQKDVLRDGFPIWHINRTVKDTGKNFNDGSYIIYLNAN